MDPESQFHIHVASRKQLFVDDLFFAHQQGITLTLNPPVDAGEVLHADRPWENGGIVSFCDLLPDPVAGHVKLYYLTIETLPDDPKGKGNSCFRLCCATSEDGVQWEKPNLGVCEFDGSTENNIVMQADSNGPPHGFHEPGRVLIDENDTPERRYKTIYMGMPHGIFGAYSADGFSWTVGNNGEPVSKAVSDSQNVVLWDKHLGRWGGYFRLWAPTRCVCRVETDDFWSWPFLEPKNVVLEPDELDERDGSVHGPGFMPGVAFDRSPAMKRFDPNASEEEFIWGTDKLEDLSGTDIYNQPVTQYPWADRVFIMPFSVLAHRPNLEEIQLSVSRDGIRWERPGDRQAWIRPPIDEHAGILYCGPGVLRTGHWIDHYYIRMDSWHHHGKPGVYEKAPSPPYVGSIHRARLRLDGYLSADAGNAGGQFVTPPIVFSGSRLELNADTGARGLVEIGLERVESDAAAWMPRVSDFSIGECDQVVCNSIARVVSWNGNEDVSSLAGKPVRMHVRMRNAKLYAFQFV